MFITIQAHEYQKYPILMDQIFRLRKKVFRDQLKWDVSVTNGREKDHYDDLNPVYLVWCNADRNHLYGVIRLMPTTGPALLYDVFRKTFPDIVSFEAPDIWEGTRMCVDDDKIATDFPSMKSGRAFSLMLLVLCEVAIQHGIHTMVSNYEPQLKRIYKRAGVEVNEMGRAEEYGKYPVCCGQFEVSNNVLQIMRSKLGIQMPLYSKMATSNSIILDLSEAA